MKSKNILIGVDPDVHMSGIASWRKKEKQLFYHGIMGFFTLFDYLKSFNNDDLIVFIEAGWMMKKSNWHGYKDFQAQKIAKNVGSNHETGRKIVEMCKYLEIEHKLVKPTKKWTSEYCLRLTGVNVNNQDIVDAIKLVYGF